MRLLLQWFSQNRASSAHSKTGTSSFEATRNQAGKPNRFVPRNCSFPDSRLQCEHLDLAHAELRGSFDGLSVLGFSISS
jgi:hypothetical protein